jgi:hypothetical protein
MSTDVSQKRASQETEEMTLLNEAVDLLNACLDSIPPKSKDPRKFWDHALKSLELGSRKGRSFDQMITAMHGALPIGGAFTKAASRKIYTLGESLKSQGRYQQFRKYVRQNAPYIVAYTQHVRDQRKIEANPTDEWMDYPTTEGA